MTRNEKESAEIRDKHVERVGQNLVQKSVAAEAKGGDLRELPPNYYWNWRFIGSLIAVVFMAQGLYLGTCQLHLILD